MSGCTMCEEKQQRAEATHEPSAQGPARKAMGALGESLAGVGEQMAQARPTTTSVAQDGFSGPGAELPDREFHERSFGRSFAHVRVYTDEAAANACRRLNARAYTVGHKIAFADASLLQNKALVAHELTHVGQHTGEGPARKSSGGADEDGIDRSGEEEAERVEAAVDEGKPARSALGDDTPGDGGGATPASSKQGPARKTDGGPWGASVAIDANELKVAGSYSFGGTPVSVPIPGVPGLFGFFRPSFQAKVQGGMGYATNSGNFTVGVGLEGSIEGGLSLGQCNVACMFLSVNGSAGGGFEFKQEQGKHWHFQGEIKFETFLAFGITLINGWALDYKREFAKLELGKLTGIRVIGTYGQFGPKLDGGIDWSWGPEVQALFNKFAKPMREVKRLAG